MAVASAQMPVTNLKAAPNGKVKVTAEYPLPTVYTLVEFLVVAASAPKIGDTVKVTVEFGI